MVGKEAVKLAAGGESGKMVTLVRKEELPYSCSSGTVLLEKVANVEKMFPDGLFTEGGNHVTEGFRRYALPLIGTNPPCYFRFA
jgi:ATP-dependent phosphofructokinase / diphosphate-dependent phosphofructokinase